ncbi:type III pantothenate kinase [Algoriphagus kandeliae]|uniref:Type III pantothenate kinase n=1 Tax=Algoriphagus kandeliae TaxID=2562278 RepID=A0A4Y9QV56_9BACT|nr:type III pantothenate kinase [Algoriphagus kandeliae]TFV95608.1 type III pantothenate kinase [Algoriphagus kandeliae]
MKNLIIDIGNTRIKSALFEEDELIWEKSFQELAEGKSLWEEIAFDACLISSVRWTREELQQGLTFSFHFLEWNTPLPIINGYGTPQTLGLDRIAAAVGAWNLAGGKAVLAIDLGSCMTFELVDPEAVYRGGAISPGMRMRARAMHEFTARLPLVSVEEKPGSPIGTSTLEGMKAGIWYGMAHEIEGHIAGLKQKFPDLQVFICGGDAQSFESLAKDHIFVVPNLVLRGLNCILNHNVKQI